MVSLQTWPRVPASPWLATSTASPTMSSEVSLCQMWSHCAVETFRKWTHSKRAALIHSRSSPYQTWNPHGCSGDAVAFHKFYRLASQNLQGLPCPKPESRSIQDTTTEVGQHSIEPLLDMAESTQETRVLAEVAASLAGLRPDELRTAQASCLLQRLRHVDDFSVAFPVARMLPLIDEPEQVLAVA